MREMENDVTDMMTTWHMWAHGSGVLRGRPSLTVGELIDLLGAFDPDEEVFVVDACDCCPTGFANLEADCVGVRDVSMADRFTRSASTDELIAAHEAAPRLEPLPLPPAQWMRRGVVIAGSRWVYYPEVAAEAAQRIAAMPGAKHIDEELIAELKAFRQRRGAADADAA